MKRIPIYYNQADTCNREHIEPIGYVELNDLQAAFIINGMAQISFAWETDTNNILFGYVALK